MKHTIGRIIRRARELGLAVPSFNIPYLPMVEPVVRAVADADSFALIAVARLEWIKFESGSLRAVAEEYRRWERPDHVRLHLDHVPAVDEDNLRVDYLPILEEAVRLGYHSVMVDASRLPLRENVAATRAVVEMAHRAGVPVEAELGAVIGHEEGPLPDYEELFASGRGFTDVAEAKLFVEETGCDWLSVAIGSVHGAVSKAGRDKEKVAARLNLERLDRLREATGVPLVLHGGSGVQQEYLLEAIGRGIAKVNVATEIRQPYERELAAGGVEKAKEAVYARTRALLQDWFRLAGSRGKLLG